MDQDREISGQLESVSAAAIVFDAPGVLFDGSAWNRWLFRLLHRVGLRADYETFVAGWETDYESDVVGGRLDYWEAMRLCLRGHGLREGCIDEIIVAGRSCKARMQRPACPLSGVNQTLMTLAGRGFGLAAIGGQSDDQPVDKLLNGWRMDQFFGFVEPDTGSNSEQIWDRLAEHYGRRDEMLLVSSSGWRLREARQAGLLTIAFNAASKAEATVQIQDIRNLRAVRCCRSRRAAG